MSDDFSLEPITDADWPEEISDMLPGFAGGLNVYRTMAHHPALLRAWTDLREHVVNQSSLGKEKAEIVILRAAFRLGSGYEWSQHILRARKVGIADQRINAMRGTIDDMEPGDAVFASAVDELFDQAGLTRETKAALVPIVGPKGILDLMATVGFYSCLGFILNSFDTPLDAAATAELEELPLEE